MKMTERVSLTFLAIVAVCLAVAHPALCAEIDAPRAIARAILEGYTKAGKTDTGTFDACPQFCDPAFTKIIVRVDKLGDGDEVGPYDYDIFCNCQDYDHQTFFIVSDRLATSARYEAVVNGSDKAQKPWTYVLVPIAGVWKITDVMDEYGSTRAGMLKALRPKSRGK